jgi:hypothetical protein
MATIWVLPPITTSKKQKKANLSTTWTGETQDFIIMEVTKFCVSNNMHGIDYNVLWEKHQEENFSNYESVGSD